MKKFSFVLFVLSLVLIMIPQASVAENFNAIQEQCRSLNSLLEDFEEMPATASTTDENVMGRFANWTFNNCGVRAPGSGNASGSHSVMMKLPSMFYSTTPVHLNVCGASLTVYNPTNYADKYRLEYSVEEGVWVTALADNGEESVTAVANTTTYCHWNLDLKSSQSAYFRIYKIGGNKNAVTYVDDLCLNYTEDAPSTFTVNGVSFTMIPVQGGSFMMGSNRNSNEIPVHEVILSDFSIGETEVTQSLWKAVMGTNPSHSSDDLNKPVECVSYGSCLSFIVKLNALTGKQFRLPTEAEWEYAAQGGNKSQGYIYAGSNDINEVAWYGGNANNKTHPVASKKPNELGLYDMSGNVLEWCYDWYGNYNDEITINPAGPSTGTFRVMRGGCFFGHYTPTQCTVSYRLSAAPRFGESHFGFRLAMSLESPITPELTNAYAVVDGSELTFYYDDQQETRTGTVYPINGAFTQCPWTSITKATFDLSFSEYYPTSTAHWFDGCYNLTEIVGIENLKTSQVTDMSFMFSSCSRLTTLDVSDFITENVTNMSAMFVGVGANELDVSCFDTRNVTDMSYMFNNAWAHTLDVSGFDINKVTNMDWMFAEMPELTTIYCDNDWSNCSATSREMFGGCYNLVGGNGTMARNVNVSDKSYARPDRSGSPGYFTAYYTVPVDNGQLQAYTVLNNGVMTFYYDDQMSHRVGKKFGIAAHVGLTMPNWFGSRRSITRAQFDASFANYLPTSTACWFYDCPNLISIDSIHNLNTSEVTSMLGMFRFCRKLTSIDVTGFNTEKVTDMSYMFCYCEGLTDLDVSNFVTDNVVNMLHMFHTCPLPSLDLTNFNTSKVTQMNTMFHSCKRLVSVYVSDLWTTDAVADNGSSMFSGCNMIVGSMGTTYDKGHINVDYAHIDGGFEDPGYLSGPYNLGDPEAYAVLADSVLTFYYDPYKSSRNGTIYEIDKEMFEIVPGWAKDFVCSTIRKAIFMPSFAEYYPHKTSNWFYCCKNLEIIEGIQYLNTDRVTNMKGMFRYCNSLSSVDVSNFNTSLVTNMAYMFEECWAVKELDVSRFNTSNVTEMERLFAWCRSLTSIDVSGFNTSKVTNMNDMFRGCRLITSLDVSGFVTGNVAYMDGMFKECRLLTSLDVSRFDTKNVIYMESMFEDCRSLECLNLNSFNTSKVTNMSAMFYRCYALSSLDVSSFNTSSVVDMSRMFLNCHSLTSLDVSGFNTSSVTNMRDMFSGCPLSSINVSNFRTSSVINMESMFYGCPITSIDVSNFNTSSVTDMSHMFAGCSLKSLDLSSFDVSNVLDIESMFKNCDLLETIYVSNKWSLESITLGDSVFNGCTSLVGGAGTTYNSNHIDYTYAHVDGGVSNPGYFTLKTLNGDVDCDGKVNINDVTILINLLLSGNQVDINGEPDVDGDGRVSISDVTTLINMLLAG